MYGKKRTDRIGTFSAATSVTITHALIEGALFHAREDSTDKAGYEYRKTNRVTDKAIE